MDHLKEFTKLKVWKKKKNNFIKAEDISLTFKMQQYKIHYAQPKVEKDADILTFSVKY